MNYVDGFVAAVPDGKKQDYIDFARWCAGLFREFGALRVVECWGDDVPEGKVTDFQRSVQLAEGESVCFSFIEWPSKDVRDAAHKKMEQHPDMASAQMPFDGKRMIYGGFQTVVDE